jgi:dihydropteroate synthase
VLRLFLLILMTHYLRPLGLVFGPDAQRLIAKAHAGPLGGMAHIGFTLAEEIVREGKAITRVVRRFEDIADSALAKAIMQKRAEFGGVALSQTRIMGIVNTTPDSFSDGGKFDTAGAAIAQAKVLASQGADILDIGGESTRPGSDPVSAAEEAARVLPVVAALAGDHVISVDTRKSVLMRQAVAAGARIINDVSALQFDPLSLPVVAELNVPIVLMHAQGEPRTMQLQPKYDDVALDVYDKLAGQIARAEAAGIARARICIDPGIGFGKTFKQNLELMQQATIFHGLGVAVLIGLSRKGYIGALTGRHPAASRLAGSLGGALQAAMSGCHLLRVHDVCETHEALRVFSAQNEPNSAQI